MTVFLEPDAHGVVYGVGLVRAKGDPHSTSVGFRRFVLEEESCIRRIVHREQSVCHVDGRRIVGSGQPGDGQTAPGGATEQNRGKTLDADETIEFSFAGDKVSRLDETYADPAAEDAFWG